MSRSATFYALSADKFAKFVKLANLAPPKENSADGTTVKLVVQKAQAAYENDNVKISGEMALFLRKYATMMVEFHWGAEVMHDLLACLEKFQHINLLEKRLETESGQWRCYVIDKKSRLQLLKKLTPSKFDEPDMERMFAQLQNIYEEELLAELKKAGRKVDVEEVKKQLQSQAASLIDEFPERGKAMIEGINLLHHVLSQAVDTTVVLLHIEI